MGRGVQKVKIAIVNDRLFFQANSWVYFCLTINCLYFGKSRTYATIALPPSQKKLPHRTKNVFAMFEL